ncbi:MAG: chromate transporter, partial [Clostridia bacterium]|nr:chromate transporter [Clostridia bacterium]
TLAVVLPSFMIILLITALLKNAFKNKYVQAVLRGLKPSVIGIVLAMGVYMLVKNCLMEDAFKINIRSIIITTVLGITAVIYKYFAKKKMSPIIMIVISSLLGMFVYAI